MNFASGQIRLNFFVTIADFVTMAGVSGPLCLPRFYEINPGPAVSHFLFTSRARSATMAGRSVISPRCRVLSASNSPILNNSVYGSNEKLAGILRRFDRN